MKPDGPDLANLLLIHEAGRSCRLQAHTKRVAPRQAKESLAEGDDRDMEARKRDEVRLEEAQVFDRPLVSFYITGHASGWKKRVIARVEAREMDDGRRRSCHQLSVLSPQRDCLLCLIYVVGVFY